MIDYLLLITGIVLLAIGGDNLVRGAVGLSERFHVPHLIIGLTVVAVGTSLPEMLVSVQAALEGAPGIAIGNIIGSNIANILLVLALPSLIRPTACNEPGMWKNLMVMLGMIIVFMGMLAKGSVERYDGAILLVLIVMYSYDQVNAARGHRRAVTAAGHAEDIKAPRRPAIIALMLAGGMIALPIGAQLTILGATGIATRLGISDEVIGLTVVAVGTSLPELATGLLAVIRRNHSVALGNVVGSNIFNTGLIMGVTAGIVPVPVGDRIVRFDMWVMLGAGLLAAAFALRKRPIGRSAGMAMLVAYCVYAAVSYAV